MYINVEEYRDISVDMGVWWPPTGHMGSSSSRSWSSLLSEWHMQGTQRARARRGVRTSIANPAQNTRSFTQHGLSYVCCIYPGGSGQQDLLCSLTDVAYCGDRLNRIQKNKRTYGQWGPTDPPQTQAIVIVIGYPPEPNGDTLLLKTPYSQVIGHG